MKNIFLFALIVLFSNQIVNAQFSELSWYSTDPVGYSTDDFGVCGAPDRKTFRVSYSHCPNVEPPCVDGCWLSSNPFRFTATLYRDGNFVSQQMYNASSDWINFYFYNVPAPPGHYVAYIKFERRKGVFCGWQTVWEGLTNEILALDTPATPDFNVDGIAIPPNGGVINTCISNITVNAAATTCETQYWIGVHESDQWWSRTGDYEWGLWFSGEAPDNISLQLLASNYSYPPYFNGLPSRQGDILLGGTLPSNPSLDRYYRLEVCTGEPTWECKYTLIRVDNTCFDDGSSEEDTNQYIVLEAGKNIEAYSDDEVSVSFEAEQNAEDTLKMEPIINPSFEDSKFTDIKIAPNPFSNSTTVIIKDYYGEEPVAFELFNTLGERVRINYTQENQFELHGQELSAGIYFYRASVDGNLLNSGKVIIE